MSAEKQNNELGGLTPFSFPMDAKTLDMQKACYESCSDNPPR
jgi:hypothetical protein